MKTLKLRSWMGLMVIVHNALLITYACTGNCKTYNPPVCANFDEKALEQSSIGHETAQKHMVLYDTLPEMEQLEVEYFAANSKLANTLSFCDGCKFNKQEVPYAVEWGDGGELADPTKKSTIMYENWYTENLLRDYALYKDQDAADLPFDDIAFDYKAVFGSTLFVWSF